MSTDHGRAEDVDILFDTGSLAATATESATAPNGKPIWGFDQVIDYMDRDHRSWPLGATVAYSFLDAAPPGTSGPAFQPLTAEERTFARAAFQLIADVANINFQETPDARVSFNDSTRIVFGLDNNAPSYEWGRTRMSFDFGIPRTVMHNAEIWINPDVVATRQWFFGGYNFKSMIHEVMHAIGVPHPGVYNASSSDTITYEGSAQFYQDSAQYTVMSYFGADKTGADHLSDARNSIFSGATPLLFDVAVLQKIYGANTLTRTGDTTYGYNATAGRDSYDFTINVTPVVCIWDSSGTDWLDLSGSNLYCRLDLNQGAFSDALSMTQNISIAYGADIENARGGSDGDFLTGNALANRLEGMAGDDTLTGNAGADVLDGGAGVDAAVYAGSYRDYAWWSVSETSWVVRDLRAGAPDARDSLISVERLQFADRTVKIAALSNLERATAAFENVLRYTPATEADKAFVDGLAARLTAGELTVAQMAMAVADKADATTAVASLAYQFFVGAIPTKAGFDYLVAPNGPNPNNLNSAYYQAFSVENRYINFAVNLGKLGEGKAAFEAEYGPMNLSLATKTAYAKIFGQAPTDQKVQDILGGGFIGFTRADYFRTYGGDDLGTKAAMVGWLLAEAEKADIGAYARSNDAFLADLADGADYQVDLVGVYGRADFAVLG